MLAAIFFGIRLIKEHRRERVQIRSQYFGRLLKFKTGFRAKRNLPGLLDTRGITVLQNFGNYLSLFTA